MRRLLLVAVTAGGLLVTTHLSSAGPQKVRVCHGALSGQGRVLEVSVNAAPAHLGHGDTWTDLPQGARCSAQEEMPM